MPRSLRDHATGETLPWPARQPGSDKKERSGKGDVTGGNFAKVTAA